MQLQFKQLLFFVLIISSFSLAQNAKAQFNPYDDGRKIGTVGVGFSGWGIPIFGRLEVPIVDNITVGGGLSFRTYSESFAGSRWRHNIFGINALGNYHFNELFEFTDEWDLYAGLTLGYYAWGTSFDGNNIDGVDYRGNGNGGLGIGAQIGGRYFFQDNIAVNLELGGGNVVAGGNIGVSFLF
ncbi:MAG: hypothetical protein AAGI07_05220 [Bacteroidota bacterium]